METGKACASCLDVNGMYEVMDLSVCSNRVASQDCYYYVVEDGLQGGVCELNLPLGRWNLPSLVRKN